MVYQAFHTRKRPPERHCQLVSSVYSPGMASIYLLYKAKSVLSTKYTGRMSRTVSMLGSVLEKLLTQIEPLNYSTHFQVPHVEKFPFLMAAVDSNFIETREKRIETLYHLLLHFSFIKLSFVMSMAYYWHISCALSLRVVALLSCAHTKPSCNQFVYVPSRKEDVCIGYH